MSSDEFWRIFDEHLVQIDDHLSDCAVPIPRRPWNACFLFLEHSISIQGMSKSELVRSPLFREFIRHSNNWYVERYGEKLVSQKLNNATAMVVLYDTPFELRIPLTLTKQDRDNLLTELHFPNGKIKSDNVLSFLVNPPNLSSLSTREIATIRNRISRIVGTVRKLNNCVVTVGSEQRKDAVLSASIPVHMEKGVNDVCSMDIKRLSSAVWEFCFAVEKALKAFLCQNIASVPKIHDLSELMRLAVQNGLPVPPKIWLRTLPSSDEAIQHRYGDLPTPSLTAVTTMYGVALRASLHCAQALNRKFSIGRCGAVIYLRSPWNTITEEESGPNVAARISGKVSTPSGEAESD